MSKILRMKQAAISPPNPTRYGRQLEQLGLSFSTVAFDIKQAVPPQTDDAFEVGFETTSFLIRQAIPPQTEEALQIGFETNAFAFKTHPSMDAPDEDLEIGFSTPGFIFKEHPNTVQDESLSIGYVATGFDYDGLPANVLWDPINLIERAQILLDDKSSVTDVSGRASQWNDRGSNAWHAQQGNAGSRPLIQAASLNGRRTLYFNGNVLSVPNALTLLRAKTAGWIFVATKKQSLDGAAANRGVFVISTDIAGYSRFGLWNSSTGDAANDANAMVPWARRLDGDSAVNVTGLPSAGTDWALHLAAVDYLGRTLSLYTNGLLVKTEVATPPTSGAVSDTNSANVVIGAGNTTASAAWNGHLACALAGRNVPNPGDIDRLFGYYAHQYGLVDLLSSDHPYKTFPPYLPKDIVALHFEGANGSDAFVDESTRLWVTVGSAPQSLQAASETTPGRGMRPTRRCLFSPECLPSLRARPLAH